MSDKANSNGLYTAQRLFSQGQGKESNPFPYETEAHKTFDAEMDRLQIEEAKREAMEP
jgi:hypothetical protein